MAEVVIEERKMSLVENLDHADALRVVGNGGVAFFYERTRDQLPGALHGSSHGSRFLRGTCTSKGNSADYNKSKIISALENTVQSDN